MLSEEIGPECDVVLLGSIASTKYVEILVDVFGERLLFPIDFVGRGDMSRGGLLLRAGVALLVGAWGMFAGLRQLGLRDAPFV